MPSARRDVPTVDPSRLMSCVSQDENGCLNWTKAIFKAGMGYGMIQVEGETWGTHRISYATFKGQIPDGMVVRHKCDNPRCINPDHLEVGTPKRNSEDMVSRGRSTKGRRRLGTGPRGDVNRNANLTTAQVLEIRERCASGYTSDVNPQKLAAEFGVTPATISKVVLRRSWTHI